MLASDEDGDRAAAAIGGSHDAIVYAPTMVAPPSYLQRALVSSVAPVVIWNAPAIGSLGRGLSQANATVNTGQVGCVMAANALIREGRRFVAVSGRLVETSELDRAVRVIRAAAGAGGLAGAVVLHLGAPVPGYVDVAATSDQLAELGVVERCVDGSELCTAMEAIPRAEAIDLVGRLSDRGWTGLPTPTRGGEVRSGRLALALGKLVERYDATCGAVNCHGGLFRQSRCVGITACLGVSLLAEAGAPLACTGDVPTGLALLLAKRLSGATLYSEFYTPELDTGLMLLAAGGEGDPSWAMANGPIRIEANHHYPGLEGNGMGLSFALAPGPATVLSLSPGHEGWRLAWATGRVESSRHPALGGPNGMFAFDSEPTTIASERWIASGATHHQALAKGRLDAELPVVAELLGIESVRV